MWGIFAALLLLTLLVYLRVNIIVAAPLCVVLVSLVNGFPALEMLTGPYLDGVSFFLRDFLLIFLLGAVSGKVISDSGASETLAYRINYVLGPSRAAAAVFMTSAILAYGGISGFVIIFSLYPIGLSLFEKAGLPRYLLPACITAGVSNLAINLPGSPQIHNIIPVEYFGTNLMAGLFPALAGVSVASIVAVIFLQYRSKRAIFKGELFVTDKHKAGEKKNLAQYPGFIQSLLPLLVVISLITLWQTPVVLALFCGIVVGFVLLYPYIGSIISVLNEGARNAVMPLLFAGSAVGFGLSLLAFPSFLLFLTKVMNLSLSPLVLSAVLVNIASGIMGSASGGMVLALTIAGEELAQLADLSNLHRIMAMASVVLDTLPHNNNYLTILAVTGLTFKETYYDYFMVTVLTPLIGLTVALIVAHII